MKVQEENTEKFSEALMRLAQAFKNETESCSKMCGGLSEKELSIMVFVGKNKNVKMSDIADNISAPMSTLTSIVDKLVDKKLLTRDHSGEDRRVINVSLSATGKNTYSKITCKRKDLAETILLGLNEKDQALLIKYIQKLASQIGISE